MIKITCLLTLSLLFFSCQQNRETLISELTSVREQSGLSRFDETMKLDSTFFRESEDNFWEKMHSEDALSEMIDSTRAENFGMTDFYSRQKDNFHKLFFFENTEGKLKLVNEYDSFYKKINDTVEIRLFHGYDYTAKTHSYSIDSIPTRLFIQRNQMRLKKMWEHAKEINAEICGTAAAEILEEGFPQRHSEIDHARFHKMKREIAK